jgi:hypothetical protein
LRRRRYVKARDRADGSGLQEERAFAADLIGPGPVVEIELESAVDDECVGGRRGRTEQCRREEHEPELERCHVTFLSATDGG